MGGRPAASTTCKCATRRRSSPRDYEAPRCALNLPSRYYALVPPAISNPQLGLRTSDWGLRARHRSEGAGRGLRTPMISNVGPMAFGEATTADAEARLHSD